MAHAFLGLSLGLSLVLSGPGCGYRLVRYDEPRPGLSSVAIRTLENDSFEPGVELLVSDALRREFLRRGAVRVLDDPDAADLVLSGAVREVRTQAGSYSSVVLALEYRVTLGLELVARSADGSLLTLDPTALTESELYLASADVEAQRKNREEALRRIAGVLAARMHETLYERFTP
jgi:hypothetical protein